MSAGRQRFYPSGIVIIVQQSPYGVSSPTASLLGAQLLEDRLERGDDFVLVDPRLAELQLQVEKLGRRLVAEDVRLWAARLGFRGFFPDGFAGGAAVAGDLLHQGDHFLWVPLPNYL